MDTDSEIGHTANVGRGELRPTGPCPSEQPLTPSPHFRNVNIDRVANGFIVRVGCQTFVAYTWDEATIGLYDYWRDPVEAEKKYVQQYC